MKPTQPIPHGRGVSGANRWRGQAQGPPQRPPGDIAGAKERREWVAVTVRARNFFL